MSIWEGRGIINMLWILLFLTKTNGYIVFLFVWFTSGHFIINKTHEICDGS